MPSFNSCIFVRLPLACSPFYRFGNFSFVIGRLMSLCLSLSVLLQLDDIEDVAPLVLIRKDLGGTVWVHHF